MEKYKWGVFLARTQPLHNGHILIIEKMTNECENVLIINGL
jgi:nicotinamide mononucleotide adenylyltransferase